MKKISILLAALLMFLLIVAASCENDPDDPTPPKPPVKYYTVTIVNDSVMGLTDPGSGPVEVDSGDRFSLALTPKIGYIADSAIVNDEKWAVEDNEVYVSTVEADYTIEPIWKKDPAYPWLFCEEPWVEAERLSKSMNGDWSNLRLDPRVIYFLPGGVEKVFSPEGVLIGHSNWKIDKSIAPMTLHTGMDQNFPEGTVEIIESLDKDHLVITNSAITIRVILRHPTEEELETWDFKN